MTQVDVAAAVDEACASYSGPGNTPGNRTDSRGSRRTFLRKLRRFVQELPDELTVLELRDELEDVK